MFWFLLVGSVVVWGAYAGFRSNAKRRDRLGAAAQELGATYHPGLSSIAGVVQGFGYDYKFVTRGSGSSSESWTELEVALTPGYPFALRFEDHRHKDHVVDVQVGSPQFDERFLLEGAPASIVAKLFLPAVQQWLLKFSKRAIEIQTKVGGAGPVLMVAMRGWTEDVAEIRQRCEIAVGLAARIRDLHRALDQNAAQLVLADGAAPYRPLASAAPLETSRQQRDHEVTTLVAAQQQRDLRRAAAQRTTVVVLVVIGAIISVLAILVAR